MRTCPSCGAQQRDWAMQCTDCGAALPTVAAPPPPPPPGYGAPPPPGYGASGPAGYGYPYHPYGYGASPPPALGGWWYRVGATIIDGVVLSVVQAVVGSVVGAGVLVGAGSSFGAAAGVELIDVVIVLAYQGLLLAYRGQTLGMMAVGTRIADASTGGGIGVWRGVLRAAIEGLLVVALFLPWVLDVLWPLWDGRNQTLHDKAVGTLVLRSR